MLGQLPQSVIINNQEYKINTDYRFALICFQILNDKELSQYNKVSLMCETLFGHVFKTEELEEASQKASWFLDGGQEFSGNKRPKTFDWEQDEQIIFSAVNKVANKEVREEEYIHWWTFLGYFNEIGEGLFTHVLSIRSKKAKGKKLTKEEKEFYSENKKMVDLREKLTEEEKNEENELLKRLEQYD